MATPPVPALALGTVAMLKYPLLPVTICYVLGIVLAAAVKVPPLWPFAVGFAAALTALAWNRARPWLLGVLLIATGAANLARRTAVLSPHDLRTVVGAESQLVTLRGRLIATPTVRVRDESDTPSWRSLAVIEAEELEHRGARLPAFGRVAVSTPGILDSGFFGGRRVEVFGVLHPPRPPRAPGLFDARRYYGWQGIYYQLDAEPGDWRLATQGYQPNRPPLPDRFIAWAQSVLARGLPEPDESLRLLWAMTLGWRTALTDEVTAPFMRSGTMHIFAISGLHIALIAGMLVALLRVLQVPRGATGLVAVPLIWFYTLATGWQASAVRSTLMMTVVIAGWALQRPGELLNSLAGSAFLILLWEPRQLFQASFQLSFFVVLSIALLLPPLTSLRDRWLQTDPFLPVDHLPRWRRWLDRPLRYLTSSVAVSVAAWLGSLPLIAYYFQLVTPVSLVANVFIVPLSSLALMSNLGALVCGAWSDGLTELFNHAAWFWMTAMVRASEVAAGLPGAWFYLAPPGMAAIGAYYALFVAITGRWFADRKYRRFALLGVGVPLLLAVTEWCQSRSESALTILPLNGGHAVWAELPGRRDDLLVDCGNEINAANVVIPFLRARGVNRLPNLALTHGDVRHAGGAAHVIADMQPRQVWTSTLNFRSPTYRESLELLGPTTNRCRRVSRGQRLAGWQVLHPAATDDAWPQADDKALVLRRDFAGQRVLLLSDLGNLGQAALLEAERTNLVAEVLVAGLPARGEPISDALLEAVRPGLIIVCDDQRPATARAGPRLRERLSRANATVIFTSDTGAISLHQRGRGWSLQTVDGREALFESPP